MLPGAERLPPDFPLLQDRLEVRFHNSPTEEETLDRLEWGITGMEWGIAGKNPRGHFIDLPVKQDAVQPLMTWKQ